MSNLDEISVDSLRRYRDEQLGKGLIGPAETTQKAIDRKLGDDESDETAALEAGRDERLHEPIDDVEELKDRQSRAEYCGFAALAAEYGERIDELTEDEDEEKSALEQEKETRAALADADPELEETTRAALGANDMVNVTERGQPAPQYVYDHYDVDPRDYNGEYELRTKLASLDPKRPEPDDDEVSDAEAALSVGDRNRIARKDTTAAELIQREYDLDPDDYDDVEELRAAIHAEGGFSKEDDAAPSRKSAFSDPNDWV